MHADGKSRPVGAFSATTSAEDCRIGRATLRIDCNVFPRLKVVAKGFVDLTKVVNIFAPPKSVQQLFILEASCSVLGKESINRAVRFSQSQNRTWIRWGSSGYLDLPFDTSSKMGHVVGHLYNFRTLLGDKIVPQYSGHDASVTRFVCSFGTWQLTIDSLAKKELEDQIHQDQFVLTHVVRIEKSSGKLFSTKEAHDVLWFLELYFGFVAGTRVGPRLCAGRRVDDPFVWIWPGDKQVTSRNLDPSWSVRASEANLAELLNDVWRLWSNRTDRKWFQRVAELYIEAKRPDTFLEQNLVVSYAALESVCSVIVVDDKKLMLLPEYSSYHTAKRLRIAFDAIGFSLDIPSWWTAPKPTKGEDLLDLITKVRNAVVHPVKSNIDWLEKLNPPSLRYCCLAAVELLSVLILYRVGYQGTYLSGLTPGDVGMPVPWLRADTAKNS